ncbi:MAG: DJ-1/PfpI family protein [Tannerellaceae bacterium]|jgi:4-methyl-5(b-hydroxyethyl)-thiazole monophosphate biosynthesis|nr:DJ-1/PfpI family protein [Tannerellaceae bacterium]
MLEEEKTTVCHKKAAIFLADGFEESEAIVTADVLIRAGIETDLISVGENFFVRGAHSLLILAGKRIDDLKDWSGYDAFILPGGMPGTDNLNNNAILKSILCQVYEEGKLLAAICAAPVILGRLGLLKRRKAVCYPGFESRLEGAILLDDLVVTDGNVITSKGPGGAFCFGLAIVEYLCSKKEADDIATGLLLIF